MLFRACEVHGVGEKAMTWRNSPRAQFEKRSTLGKLIAVEENNLGATLPALTYQQRLLGVGVTHVVQVRPERQGRAEPPWIRIRSQLCEHALAERARRAQKPIGVGVLSPEVLEHIRGKNARIVQSLLPVRSAQPSILIDEFGIVKLTAERLALCGRGTRRNNAFSESVRHLGRMLRDSAVVVVQLLRRSGSSQIPSATAWLAATAARFGRGHTKPSSRAGHDQPPRRRRRPSRQCGRS